MREYFYLLVLDRNSNKIVRKKVNEAISRAVDMNIL